MFQVLYKDNNGRQFTYNCKSDEDKEDFVKILSAADIEWYVRELNSTAEYQVAYVAFSIDDAELILAGKKDPYTFADPEKFATGAKVVKVELEDGRKKNVIPVWTNMKTVPEMFQIAHKLGRKKLCKVISRVA